MNSSHQLRVCPQNRRQWVSMFSFSKVRAGNVANVLRILSSGTALVHRRIPSVHRADPHSNFGRSIIKGHSRLRLLTIVGLTASKEHDMLADILLSKPCSHMSFCCFRNCFCAANMSDYGQYRASSGTTLTLSSI